MGEGIYSTSNIETQTKQIFLLLFHEYIFGTKDNYIKYWVNVVENKIFIKFAVNENNKNEYKIKYFMFIKATLTHKLRPLV